MKNDAVEHTWLQLDTGTHTEPIVQLCVSADGKTVVSAGDCSVRVWDADTRRLRRQLLGHTRPRVEGGSADGSIQRMALSPDGRWLLTVKNGHRIEVFNTETGNLASAFEHPDQIDSVDVSPDGRWVAFGVTSRQGPVHRRGAAQLFSAHALTRAGFDQPPSPTSVHPLGQTGMVDELMHLVVVLRFIPARLSSLPWPKGAAGAQGLGLVAAVHSISAPRLSRLQWLSWQAGQGFKAMAATSPSGEMDPSTLAVSAERVVVATSFDPDDERGQGNGSDNFSGNFSGLGRFFSYGHRGHCLGETVTEAPPAAMAFSPNGG